MRVKWPLHGSDCFIGKHSLKSCRHVPQCVAGANEYVISVSMYVKTPKSMFNTSKSMLKVETVHTINIQSYFNILLVFVNILLVL